MNSAYFDYAASTPVKHEVIEDMNKYHREFFGNPSSIHSYGRENKNNISKAKKIIADSIGAKSSEIIFTSGGTEADNLALIGIAKAYSNKGKHIIISSIEHRAILYSAKFLESCGFEISYLPVDSNGLVSLKDLEKTIRDDTVLVSVMFANNEIGIIQDIHALASVCKEKNIIFHTDAVQAYGNIEIDVNKLGIDAMSISAHKFYGPKGVGALYIRKGTKLDSLIHGGSQEMGKRAGTENIAGIMGMARAVEIARVNFYKHSTHLKEIKSYLLDKIKENELNIEVNGDPEKCLNNILSLSIPSLDSNTILIALDRANIAISVGSACSSGSLNHSHVLKSIGLCDNKLKSTFRVSFGDFTSKEDCDYLIENLIKIAKN